MRRPYALPLIGLLLLALACSAIGWRLSHPPLAAWLVAGATQVQATGSGFGQLRISYQAPGQPYAWYFELLRRIAQHEWQAPVDTRTRISAVPDVHWRLRRLGPIYLEEQVAIWGEPNYAQIELRRRIIVPWRQWLGLVRK